MGNLLITMSYFNRNASIDQGWLAFSFPVLVGNHQVEIDDQIYMTTFTATMHYYGEDLLWNISKFWSWQCHRLHHRAQQIVVETIQEQSQLQGGGWAWPSLSSVGLHQLVTVTVESYLIQIAVLQVQWPCLCDNLWWCGFWLPWMQHGRECVELHFRNLVKQPRFIRQQAIENSSAQHHSPCHIHWAIHFTGAETPEHKIISFFSSLSMASEHGFECNLFNNLFILGFHSSNPLGQFCPTDIFVVINSKF